MSLLQRIKDIFTVNDSIMDETFSLGERYSDQEEPEEEESPRHHKEKEVKGDDEGGFKKPLKPGEIQAKRQGKEGREGEPSPEEILGQDIDLDKLSLSASLEENKAVMKKAFRMPVNKDVVIRDLTLPLEKEVKAFLIYTEGMSSRDTINLAILEPLMHLSRLEKDKEKDTFDLVYEELLPSNQVEKKHKVKDLVEGILGGLTAVFIEGFKGALIVETRGMPSRSVGAPTTEMSIRGPQEGFTEHFRTNTALIRKYLHSERLITEMVKVGELTRTDVAIFYLDGITNIKLVREVKRRLKAINIDNAMDSGVIEQLISDNPSSLLPGTVATERPDRTCAYLMEGHVAIVVDGNPFVLIAPITFWGLLHTPEDYTLNWNYGTFLRIVRTFAFFVALLTPALYIAVSNYHQEMIPTDLLLAAAAARERVPFPAIVEVLLMEASFELIREAGTRAPNIIGNTIGIVGALILGQAAVQAGIVSPLLVIVVALTALGSFAIPNYSLSFGLRIARFIFILAASVLGLYGVAIVLFIYTLHLCGLKTFGVPVMSPVAPFRPPSKDIVIRYPFWQFNKRPGYLRTGDEVRQKAVTRTWDPATEGLETRVAEDIPGFEEKQKGRKEASNNNPGAGGKKGRSRK